MLTSISFVVLCFSCICAKSLYSVNEVNPFEYEKSAMTVTSNLLHEDVHSDRTKRSVAEECEEMELCKLHARSGHSLLASFQLYFVNKENAKLWDHKQHSIADCEQRYQGCYEGRSEHDKQTKQIQFVDNNTIDEDEDEDDVADDDY